MGISERASEMMMMGIWYLSSKRLTKASPITGLSLAEEVTNRQATGCSNTSISDAPNVRMYCHL